MGPLTLFSREVRLAPAGGTTAGSVPSPADARGAIAVGAVDWRGDRLRRYSSQGPSPDGRLKPDLVAPTDTSLLGPNGVRGVGGTSNAAPNAAGAAAILMAAERVAGRPGDAASVLASLQATAFDWATRSDPRFGWGRVRVSLTPPVIDRPSRAEDGGASGRLRARKPHRQRAGHGVECPATGAVASRQVRSKPVAASTPQVRTARRGGFGRGHAGHLGRLPGACWSTTRTAGVVEQTARVRGRGPHSANGPCACRAAHHHRRARRDSGVRGPLRVSVSIAGVRPRVFTMPPRAVRASRSGGAPGRHVLRAVVRDRAANRHAVSRRSSCAERLSRIVRNAGHRCAITPQCRTQSVSPARRATLNDEEGRLR